MSNSYFTEQYVGSVLSQYQPNSQMSGHKSPMNRNLNQLNEYLQEEDTKRRLMRESVFKRFDQNSISRPVISSDITSNIVKDKNKEMGGKTSIRSLFTYGNEYQKSSQTLPQTNRWSEKSVTVSSAESYDRSVPKTNDRSQAYSAKVIDYTNVSKKPQMTGNRFGNNQIHSLPVSNVLTELNFDGIKSMRLNQSYVSQPSNLLSNKQTVNRPLPKSILKKSVPSATTQMTKILPQSRPDQNLFAVNTTAIRKNYTQSSAQQQKTPIVERKQTQSNGQFRDTLLSGFENSGIIKTYDLDKNELFYCFYCNNYIKKVATLEKHCKNFGHINNINRGQVYNSGLNREFVSNEMKVVDTVKSMGLTAQTLVKLELDRIPMACKHYYYRKGIRLQELGGQNSYFCKVCEKPIKSLENIENHLLSESHKVIEEMPTIDKLLSQTTEPILGLHVINEYKCLELSRPLYECQLCQCFQDSRSMFSHICSFEHRLALLQYFNPNESSLKSIKNSPQAVKEIARRMSDLHRINGTGVMNTINSKPPFQRSVRKRPLNSRTNVDLIDEQPVRKKSYFEKLFAVKLFSDDDAADASILIQNLNESVVKYYLGKIPINLRKLMMNKVVEELDNEFDKNY